MILFGLVVDSIGVPLHVFVSFIVDGGYGDGEGGAQGGGAYRVGVHGCGV